MGKLHLLDTVWPVLNSEFIVADALLHSKNKECCLLHMHGISGKDSCIKSMTSKPQYFSFQKVNTGYEDLMPGSSK